MFIVYLETSAVTTTKNATSTTTVAVCVLAALYHLNAQENDRVHAITTSKQLL